MSIDELDEFDEDNCPNSKCSGGSVITYLPWPHTKSTEHYVACNGCGMRGPIGHTPEEAVFLWNELKR